MRSAEDGTRIGGIYFQLSPSIWLIYAETTVRRCFSK